MAKEKVQSKSLEDNDEFVDETSVPAEVKEDNTETTSEDNTPVEPEKSEPKEEFVVFHNGNNYDVTLKYKDDIYVIPPGAVTDKFNVKDVDIESLNPGINYRFV